MKISHLIWCKFKKGHFLECINAFNASVLGLVTIFYMFSEKQQKGSINKKITSQLCLFIPVLCD